MPPPPPPPPSGPPVPVSGPPPPVMGGGGGPAFLADIRQGKTLKKVPDSQKKDRSGPTVGGAKSGGGSASGASSGSGSAGPPMMGGGLGGLFANGMPKLKSSAGTINIERSTKPVVQPKPDRSNMPLPPLPSGDADTVPRSPAPMMKPPAPRPPAPAAPRPAQQQQPPPPPPSSSAPAMAKPPPPPPPPAQQQQPPQTASVRDYAATFSFLSDHSLPAPPAPYTGPRTYAHTLCMKRKAPSIPGQRMAQRC